MALFLAHTVILAGLAVATAQHLIRPALERLLAAALLFWSNIVLTSLALSCWHRLGESTWFFRTSLLLGLLTWLALRRLRPEPAPEPAASDRPDTWLLVAFAATLLPIAYIGVRLAVVYEPNNYDTLTYHLPRAMFYLGQQNLAHFYTGNDRQTYFPFNYNLLQLFGLIYGPPTQVVNFFNLAAWGLAGAALYRLGRLCAFGANASLVATWLTLTTTQVLGQATATNNDLPTGAALLAGLVFALRWHITRRSRDALLGGVAAGLAVGSKLTVLFFGPTGALLVLAFGYQHWRTGRLGLFFRGVAAWIGPGILAFALASPFAFINHAAQGKWITQSYDFTLNRPFSAASALQTSEAYLVQLFIEPLHRFTFDLRFTEQLNAWGTRTFFPHWNEAYAFSPLYLFPPDLNEDHVWFGFAGPVIFLAGLFCLVRSRRSHAPAVWLACTGLGWFATYFLLNKWSLYNQRYFVMALLVLGPCLAAVLEAGWSRPRLRRGTWNFVGALVALALWLDGVYLFANTSRPYAPLWAGQPAPPALPVLPPLIVQRLADQPRINIDSTHGNERIFLFMTLGRHQRFTARAEAQPDAYNVFSEWGFVRKVAYTNIEQRSSYTIVAIPTKRSAGVEFLGTLDKGGSAQDYYGLMPRAGELPAAEGNRNVLVVFNYGPHEPDRYRYMGIKVAGLNARDQARLQVSVEFEDGTTETLATFTADGMAPAPVLRPFRRFVVRAFDQAGGRQIGAVDVPHVVRNRPADVEASNNPGILFSDELVALEPKTLLTTGGLSAAEGPYPAQGLPLIRWVKAPVFRMEIPATEELNDLEVYFSLRLMARDSADIDVVFNGDLVKSYLVKGHATWLDDKLELAPRPGKNVLEFRNVSVGTAPDWLDYLERYPDVKAYVLSQKIPLERGAREHWEMFGRKETRTLNTKHQTEAIQAAAPLYYLFRNLQVEGYRKP